MAITGMSKGLRYNQYANVLGIYSLAMHSSLFA